MKITNILFILFLFTLDIYASDELRSDNLSIGEANMLSLEELLNVTIISSTGTKKTILQAPSIATVITAKQIEKSSARTLDEVLAMVPGLHVYLSPSDIQSNSYDIRGIRTNSNAQILTLMNGVPIDSVSHGTALQRFNYPASAIKRIEVIRGPGSAIYGADAFAGVINIITKDAKYLKENSQAGIRYGSFDRAEIYVNYGEIYDSGLEFGLNLSYMTSNGDKNRIIKSDLQTSLDNTFGTFSSLAPGSYNDNYDIYNLNLNLNYNNLSINIWTHLAKNIGTGAGAANILDPVGKIENAQIITDFNYDLYLTTDIKWNNKLTLSHMNLLNELVLFPAGAILPIGSDGNAFTSGGGLVEFTNGFIGYPSAKEEKVSYESTISITQFKNHNIRLSTGYSYVRLTADEKKNFGPGLIDGTVSPINGNLVGVAGTPYIYISNEDRKVFFISAQDEYTLNDNLYLTTGIRYDHYSDFGNTINPRIGLVWNTTNSITTKLLYGRAFRAPSFEELYNQNNPVSLGNKNLDPETIDMLEFGINYSPNSILNASLNTYWYEINNLIEGVITPSGLVSKNIGRQHGAGIELEASFQATDKLLLSANYAYRWTKNEITNMSVANVPKHIGSIIIDYSFIKNWYLNSEIQMVADTPREVNDNRKKISSYRIVNASLGYRINKNIEASIAARNLFDKKYYSPSNDNPKYDYPMEGLNVFADLKYKF